MKALGPRRSPEAAFSGSYRPEDVQFLLRPVEVEPTEIAAKERLIQSGRRHYSEMIAPERPPGAEYLRLYREALDRNGARLAGDIGMLAAALAERSASRREIVLVSLARAGTPIGILLRRAVGRLGLAAPHYSISIIRDRGIDCNALGYIAARHDPADAIFVDGWTGKGAIAAELHRSLDRRPFGFRPWLAVVADPAGRADLAATRDDYLIPSGLLNAIVSGLVSRSILNAELVGPDDFHACVHYPQFASSDLSAEFVDTIDRLVPVDPPTPRPLCEADRQSAARRCDDQVAALMERFGVEDRNRIKPGIAEATRAVLRRLPERLLIRDPGDPDIAHLIHLAREKDIGLDPLPPDSVFRAIAIIRKLAPE